MGVVYEDVVVIRHAEKAGDPTVITVNCPDKTGLGCDLCRIVLLFGLSISRGGKPYSQLFNSFFFLVCGVWNLWPNEWRVIVNFLFFTFFSEKFCSWGLIFLTNKKLIIVILPIILFFYKNFGLKFEKQIRGLFYFFY